MMEKEYTMIADRLLEPVLAQKPFESPLIELSRRAAEDRVEEVLRDPRGAGLSDEGAARRADLIRWVETRQVTELLRKEKLKIFFRSSNGRPWREGYLLDFDKGYELRIQTQDEKGREAVVVVNPDNQQVVTPLERDVLRLKAQLTAAERAHEARSAELKGFRGRLEELEKSSKAARSQVSAFLPRSKTEKRA